MKKQKRNTGKPLGGYAITMMDWQKMHPFTGKIYDTDRYYHQMANLILAILEARGFSYAFDPKDVRKMALNLAAYFEDVVSELGLFAVFITEYRQKFAREFPWYNIEEEYLLDEVNLVDVRLVLWMSMLAARDVSVPNPENQALIDASLDIYNLFWEEFENAPVNRELGDDIYEERILDVAKLKTLLMWMASSCYIFPLMYPVRKELKHTFKEIFGVFSDGKPTPGQITYMQDSYKCFSQPIGLAMYAKDWYVKMREQMLIYAGNKEFREIKASPVYPFAVVKDNGASYTLRSCRGREYEVDKKSFSQTDLRRPKVGDMVISMLFYYNGLWHICGLSYTYYINDLKIALEKLDSIAEGLVDDRGSKVDLAWKVDEEIPNNSPYGMAYEAESCRKAIAENKGSRLFYFKSLKDAVEWVDTKLLTVDDGVTKSIDDLPKTNDAIVVYITDDNRVMLSSAADSIHDPANPYYQKEAEKYLLSLMLEPEQLPNPMLKYLVDHNYTDRFALTSLLGEEHGRKLVQDNLRFFLTLVRQYPFYKE